MSSVFQIHGLSDKEQAKLQNYYVPNLANKAFNGSGTEARNHIKRVYDSIVNEQWPTQADRIKRFFNTLIADVRAAQDKAWEGDLADKGSAVKDRMAKLRVHAQEYGVTMSTAADLMTGKRLGTFKDDMDKSDGKGGSKPSGRKRSKPKPKFMPFGAGYAT